MFQVVWLCFFVETVGRGMSISEPKNGGEGVAPGGLPGVSAGADIEEALDFLDSEEYQDVGMASAHRTPSTTGSDPAQASRQNDAPAIKPQHEKVVPPQKVGSEGAKSKKTGKVWLLIVSIATLLFLAVFFLYK